MLPLFAQTVLPESGLGFYDWGTLILYFAVLLGVAWRVIRQKTDTSKDYFLAGKNAGWLIVGASLFCSNIGSEHLVGLAGTGASDGMAMAHYELHAWCLLVLGWIMVPFYERSCVYTMPEFLERRYGASARWFLSVVSLIAYVLTKISVTLFAGGIVVKALFPVDVIPGIDNFWAGAFGMVFITGIYTVLGGLRAVLYTEVFQTFVLLLGSGSVLFIGLYQAGGWEKLKESVQGTDKIYGYKIVAEMPAENAAPVFLKDTAGREIIIKRPKSADDTSRINYLAASELTDDDIAGAELARKLGAEDFDKIIASNPNRPKDTGHIIPAEKREKADHFNLWKPNSHPVYPWFGLLFGAPIVGLWYWTTDQYIVQRALAARNQTEARRGTIFAGYLKMLPVFIFIVPGMIAYGLAVQGKISADVLFEPNQAFPILVKEVLPVGLRGLVVGGLLAALMSSLSSVFNSCSTLFTMDIYQKLNPKASERNLVWVGRTATCMMVVVGLLWIPIIRYMPGTMYDYLQSVQSYIAPPIAAVFFLGIFIKRVNVWGCMAGLITGFVLGMLRLALEITRNAGYAPDFFAGNLVSWFTTVPFTFMCIYLTLACVFVIVVVSLLTPKPKEEQLIGLTYATSTAEQRQATRAGWNWIDVVLTGGLLAVILSIYLYFTG